MRVFRDLEPIQRAAARMLSLSGFLSPTELENDRIVRTGSTLPDELLQKIENSDLLKNIAESFVIHQLAQIPFLGEGGLKQRTGLLEHRYDNV